MRTFTCIFMLALLFVSCDTEKMYHTVVVTNGSGSGYYELGESVAIEADPAPGEQAFFEWIGDTSLLSATRSPATTFEMPLRDVYLEATYSSLPQYTLTIEGGSGSGKYLAGTIVAIEADPAPEFHVFNGWDGPSQYLAAPQSGSTTVEMPEEDITFTATYLENPDLVSFSAQILPIIEANCNTVGCHSPLDVNEPLTNYEEVKKNLLDVQIMVLNGTMPPPPDVITQSERELILLWIEQGAPDN
jgi:hypothetical protein